jgi:hypothetical protein
VGLQFIQNLQNLQLQLLPLIFTIMDRQELLTPVEKGDDEFDETAYLRKAAIYEATATRRRFLYWLPWVLHFTGFLSYGIVFAFGPIGLPQHCSTAGAKQWPGMCQLHSLLRSCALLTIGRYF